MANPEMEAEWNCSFEEKIQPSSFCCKSDLSLPICTTVLNRSKSSSILCASNIESWHSTFFVCGFLSDSWLSTWWVSACSVSYYRRVASPRCHSLVFLDGFANPEWLTTSRAKLVYLSNHSMDGENNQHQARAVWKTQCVTIFSCTKGSELMQSEQWNVNSAHSLLL